MNRPAQKAPLWQNGSSRELAPQLERSQFCIQLNTLMIVKMDVVVDQTPSFSKGLDLRSVDTLCFEDREKAFCQSIIIRIGCKKDGGGTMMGACGSQ